MDYPVGLPVFMVLHQCTGNYTFAALKGSENYPLLASLMEVLQEMNSLLDDPYIAISGERMKLQILLGGDLKVCGVPLTNFEVLQ